jgi:molecular chaperone HtpG
LTSAKNSATLILVHKYKERGNMKEFKTESKKLMDLMINSIYTNKEIFLREIISNASDAIDKLHYKSLTDKKIKIDKDKLEINISIDKDKRLLSITDNGIGMTKEELESNLGTIAKSGSQDFKNNNEKKEDIDIIGQFGVGFYSAFMVASQVRVVSKAYGSDEANEWLSKGIEGYTIKKAERDDYGTTIELTIKENDDEDYDQYLEYNTIERLIKKYSDYITYPIKMEEVREVEDKESKEKKEEREVKTLNSLVPLWKRRKNEITDEEYDTFYKDKFFDYESPISHIHTSAEGTIEYNSLLYIPSHAPFNYYSKDYEKGLQLYSNGVLIMEKCADLLPDYLSFVKGVVDSPDLSLNISRETLQQNRVLKTIANSIENKIIKELERILKEDREKYEMFYKDFALQLKFGIYNEYGLNKDKIKDLILFNSSNDLKQVSLKEYVDRKKDGQTKIYYACGDSIEMIDKMPKVESLKEKYEILYCTEYIDEFALLTLREYEKMEFANIATEDVEPEEEKEELKKNNEEAKGLFDEMLKAIPEVSEIKFTNNLKNHPVVLTTKGAVSIEMEKAMKLMPNADSIKATKVLEINESHEIASKLKDLYENDKEGLEKYTKVLYAQARLIEGLSIDNPTEISNIICEYLSK